MINHNTFSDQDIERYKDWQKKSFDHWENLCHRCGACCGAMTDDPCRELLRTKTGTYVCRVYKNRFGARQTVSGKPFKCVPIRQVLHKSWPGDQKCGYKKAPVPFCNETL